MLFALLGPLYFELTQGRGVGRGSLLEGTTGLSLAGRPIGGQKLPLPPGSLMGMTRRAKRAGKNFAFGYPRKGKPLRK